MSDDLFAPPSKEELGNAMFAPPSPHEMADIEPRKRRKLSPAESAISGAAQAVSLTWADEIAGGMRAGLGYLQGEGNFGDLYNKYHNEQTAYNDAAKADNPGSYLLGNIGGAFANPLTETVGGAAAVGGLIGAGSSKHNPIESPGELKKFGYDVAGGVATGGIAQYGINKLGQFFQALKPESVKGFAEERAVKAAGAMTKEMRELKESGKLHEVGRDILDNNIIKVFGSLDDVSQRAGKIKKTAGAAIGQSVKDADNLVSKAKDLIDNGELFGFLPQSGKEAAKEYVDETFQGNMKNVANRIRTEIIEPNKDIGTYQGEIGKLENLANFFDGLGVKSLGGLRKQKTAQGKNTKFGSDTVPAAFSRDVYGIFKTELEDVMGRIGNLDQAISQKTGLNLEQILAKKLPSTSSEERANLIQQAFIDANKQYSMASTVKKMADRSAGRIKSNQQVGLKDAIIGAAGVAGGNVGGGLALGVLSNLTRKYGNTIQAVGADKLYQVMSKAPNALGEFGSAIESAAKQSPLALIMTHRLLMKNPDYQNILNNFEPQQRGLRLPEDQEQNGIRVPK